LQKLAQLLQTGGNLRAGQGLRHGKGNGKKLLALATNIVAELLQTLPFSLGKLSENF
jgi:hypothetical protein